MKKALKITGRILLVLFVLVNIITAFHAYKFTHFYDHGTVMIKKAEDKSGWDITKEILTGINAEKKPNTVVPDSSFEKVLINTKDHIQLEGWYIKTNQPSKGTVLLFHGHGSTRSGIFAESKRFRELGYHTFLLDFRAHGSSGGNTCTIGVKEAEDVQLAYQFIQSKEEKNIILWGISMGAAAISKSIHDYHLKPAKVILEMPFGSILLAAEGRIKMMHLPPEPLASFITFWGGTEHGFWAFGMKPMEYVKSIQCPVLLQWGANDPRVSKAETEAIFNAIPTSKKWVVYEQAAHESLCEKEPEKWLSEIQNFLSSK